MTKAELVIDVALKTGLPRTEIMTVVEAAMESIEDKMAEGENIYLRGFGSFICKKRAQKVARNISKKTSIIVPEHNIPAFKPSKEFIQKLK